MHLELGRIRSSHDRALRILAEGVRSGRLMGQVLDVLTEAPVVTAAVSIRGRPAVIDTNQQGRFVLTGVPPGEHVMEVRRIGYAPLRHSVTVGQRLTTDVEIGLVPAPVEMEPIVATATRVRRLEITGFYERKHWGELTGLGHFITADEIDRWRPSSIADTLTACCSGAGGSTNSRRLLRLWASRCTRGLLRFPPSSPAQMPATEPSWSGPGNRVAQLPGET